MSIYDIAIIGGGASGLAAAISSAQILGKGCKVVVLEGNQKLGKKLLATGNGRCNLTNMNIALENYHGEVGRIEKLLSEYTPEYILDFFKGLGLLTTVDDEGRVYPNNKQAAAVLSVLASRAELLGVETVLEFNCNSVVKFNGSFIIKSNNGKDLIAKSCIIATGGAASPNHSSSQDGYSFCHELGVKQTNLLPCLVQLTSKDRILKKLAGIRVTAGLKLYDNNKLLKEEKGELQFTDKALSGICVFQLSVMATDILNNTNRKLKLEVDLTPMLTSYQLFDALQSIKDSFPDLNCGEWLSGIINTKLAKEIILLCGINHSLPISSIDKRQISMIVSKLKCLSFEIDGTKGFNDAQVTAGGIHLSELDEEFMVSKVDGLYCVGEIVNIHGDCGGYNLHFAWSSGIKAGKAAAYKLLN